MALIPRDRLQAFLGGQQQREGSDRRVPYPTAQGVVYTPPNADSTRKQCATCWKWVTDGTCMEVAGSVRGDQVCGYHVFGKPQPAVLLTEDHPKLSPSDAGLIDTPGGSGTSCDRCRFFTPDQQEPDMGLCEAVGSVDGLPPVVVEKLGCCARWELGRLDVDAGPPGREFRGPPLQERQREPRG